MKYSLQVIFLMLITVTKLCNCQSSSISVETLIKRIDVASEKANSIYQSLSTADKITPEDAVFAYLDAFSVIGTVVQIFNDSELDTQKLILNKLDNISKPQEDVLKLMGTLEKKIDFIVTSNQITQSTSYITSCSVERIYFLRNPNLGPEQNRLLLCYDNIMKDVRLLARILTEMEASLPNLFQVTISTDGFCDGTKILIAYKYLLGNVVGGCETAIIAERLKYNGASELLLQECKAHIKDIAVHLKTIFRVCTSDSCPILQKILTSIVQSSSDRDTDHLLKQISGKLPWFTFSILKFKAKTMLQIIGNLIPSIITFYAKDLYLCVLWTPYETRAGAWDNSVTGFSLQFNPDNFENAAMSMNVSKNLQSNPAYITSTFVKDNMLAYKACANSEVFLNDRQINANVRNVAYLSSWLFPIFVVLFVHLQYLL